MFQKDKSILLTHISILLFAFSGVIGKYLTLPAFVITFGRVLFSSVALLLIQVVSKRRMRLARKKHYAYMAFLGLLLAAHWSFFYASIQLSTVALGLLSFSTYPVFVTFLEPLFFRKKLRTEDILAALVVFAGIALAVPSFALENAATKGILIGVFSGLTYAVFSVFNKKLTSVYTGLTIAFYEQAVACIILLPCLFVYRPAFTVQDMLLLALLGIVCTGIAQTMFIGTLKYIRTQTASIITCLEPIYSTILAYILLGEVPSPRDILGGVIVIGSVLYMTLRSIKREGKKNHAGNQTDF